VSGSTPPPQPPSEFWQEQGPNLEARLACGSTGLTTEEASRRLELHGPNVLRVAAKHGFLWLVVSRFRNPLVLLLLVAGAIAALTGDVPSSGFVIVMALLSVILDVVQEHRAGRAAERLRESVAVRVSVLRDGKPGDLPASDLVPGDVVLLSAGNLVPADGRVLSADDCFVNQALLTGEPYPVEKHAGEAATPDAALDEAANAVFMGTSVVSGSARVLICRTGKDTALGQIGASLRLPPPPTAFEVGTRSFGLLILRLAVVMVLFVLLVCALRDRPWLESFLFAVALAVGLTPELLPMVVSVTLSQGAIRMAREKVVVKRLAAIHDLGSMDVLCTDKTGTLTEAQIRLQRHLDPMGTESARVLRLAYLNSYFETGLKSPLDDAILASEPVDVTGWTKIDEVPFDFERRRVSVLVADPSGKRLLIVKGAPEDILRLSTECENGDAGEQRPLEEALGTQIEERVAQLGRQGYRVLGIAWKEVPSDHPHAVVDDESQLVLAGFAAFEDPPKQTAAAACRALAASGVSVKIVTGDNELVTRHLCGELDLPITDVVTGKEIEALGDQALEVRAEQANLFCRLTPGQKNRVILALRRRGHVVGYLGDGINDAPPLHSADVAISVDTGVDVAKEAADLILLEADLGVLHHGVLDGRRTFGNIMKYLMMGTSSNFGNMFSMAGAALFLPFLPMRPGQILLNNFLYDVSEIAIPMDTVDDTYVRRPRRWDTRFIRNYMLAIGPVSSLFDFLTFFVMLRLFGAGEALFQTGWFIESLATQVLVIFVIRTRGNPFKSRPAPALAIASLAVIAIGILLPLSPLAPDLGFVPPPSAFFLVLTGMVVVYLCGVELVKRWFFKRFG
jgi:Mg2+-importing ATPase